MSMGGRSGLLTLALALAVRASAATGPLDAVSDMASGALDTASHSDVSPSKVRDAGVGLQDAIEGTHTNAVVAPQWHYETNLAQKPYTTSDLAAAAGRNIHLDNDSVPGPTLGDAASEISKMDGEGRVNFAQLPSATMGTYDYNVKLDPRGRINVSDFASYLPLLLGEWVVAKTILGHEIGHAMDERLHQGHPENKDMETVIREETAAFTMQQRMLRASEKTVQIALEKIAALHGRMQRMQKEYPSPLGAAALALLENAHHVMVAVDASGNPDQAKLAEIVRHYYDPNGAPKGG
jgi:hypothetical protein